MQSLYQYPNFKNIEITDKPVFDKFKHFPNYSDFNLLSLLSWNSSKTNAFSILNNNLILRVKDYLGTDFLYSLLGEEKLEESIDLLLKEHQKLSMVPAIVIEKLKNKEKYNFQEDRDNFDYIISTERLIKLEGHDLKHLHKEINHFLKLNPIYEIKTLDVGLPEDHTSVLDLTKDWVIKKHYDEEKMKEEIEIISLFMDYTKHFDCILLGLYVDNKLIAYTFNEIVSPEMYMGHFGKSNIDFEFASYFIEYETSKYFFEKGFKFLNHEQDTGLLGLRAAKLSYAPIYFLKKYSISAIS